MDGWMFPEVTDLWGSLQSFISSFWPSGIYLNLTHDVTYKSQDTADLSPTNSWSWYILGCESWNRPGSAQHAEPTGDKHTGLMEVEQLNTTKHFIFSLLSIKLFRSSEQIGCFQNPQDSSSCLGSSNINKLVYKVQSPQNKCGGNRQKDPNWSDKGFVFHKAEMGGGAGLKYTCEGGKGETHQGNHSGGRWQEQQHRTTK